MQRETYLMEVKVDIDYKPIDVGEIAWRIQMIEEILGVEFHLVKIYETGKGYHVKAWLRGENIDDKDLIIIQLALGSDYMRELYNLRRVKNGVKNWNVLFVRKWRYDEEKGEWVEVSRERLRADLTLWTWIHIWEIRAKDLVKRYLQTLKEKVKGVIE